MNIVFFDGVCGLCNKTVDFLLVQDRHQRLKFAPIQGSTAQSELPEKLYQDTKTIIFKKDAQVYIKSDALLQILYVVGGLWRLTALFKIIPRFLRDMAYDIIAENRYKWFGRRDSCRLPTPEEKTRFLP